MNVKKVRWMSDNSNSGIPFTANNQQFSSLSQNNSENLEISLEPFDLKDVSSQDQNSPQKQIRIVPKAGSSTSELRSSLKHALQILDRMQADKENEVDTNLNRNLNILNSSQDHSDFSKSDKLAKAKAYKIIRKRKFVPYRRTNNDQRTENSQDKTEVSLFLETADKIDNDKQNANKPSNLNLDNTQFTTREINLLSDSDQNSVDLDELANSLGIRLEVSDQGDEGEVDTKFVNVSDFISKDSNGNRLLLGDRMKMLEQIITITEGDLDHLAQAEKEINNTEWASIV